MNIKHRLSPPRAARLASQVLAPAIVAALLAAPGAPAQAKPGKIVWQTNFERAMAQAKKSGKPVFVDFFATWCGPCKALDAKVFPDARVVKAARSYIMVKVDADKRPDIIKKYNVQGYPSLGFFSPSGKLLKLQLGAPLPKKVSGDQFQAISIELSRMLKTYSTPRGAIAFR